MRLFRKSVFCTLGLLATGCGGPAETERQTDREPQSSDVAPAPAATEDKSWENPPRPISHTAFSKDLDFDTTKHVDTAFISDDFFAAAVLHPRRMIRWWPFPLFPKDDVIAETIERTGMDPRDMRQVVVLATPDAVEADDGHGWAAVVRFAASYDRKDILATVAGGTRPVQHEGKSYYGGSDGNFCLHFADNKTVVVAQERLLRNMLATDEPDSPLVQRLRKTDMRHDVILCGEVDPIREIVDRAAAKSEDRQAREYWTQYGNEYVGATLQFDFSNVWVATVMPKTRLLMEDDEDRRLSARLEQSLLEHVPATGKWTFDVRSLPNIESVHESSGPRFRSWTERNVVWFLQDYLADRVHRLWELPLPQDRWLARALRASFPRGASQRRSVIPDKAPTTEKGSFSVLTSRGNSLRDYNAAWGKQALAGDGGSLLAYNPPTHLVREMLWGGDSFYAKRYALVLAMELWTRRNRTPARHRRGAKTDPSSPERPSLSWRVHLLPLLGHQELYGKFDLGRPWDSPQNKKLLADMPEIFESPGVSGEGLTTALLPAGPGTPYEQPGKRQVPWDEIVDGVTRTIQFPDVAPEYAVPWTKPVDLAYDPQAPTRGLNIDPDTESFRAVFFDGSLRAVRVSQDTAGIHAFFSHVGNETRSNEEWERDAPLLAGRRHEGTLSDVPHIVAETTTADDWPFIPSSANAALVVNAQNILRDWPFPMFPKAGTMTLVKQKAGIDLDKIEQVVFLSSLTNLPDSDGPQPDVGIIVRGNEPFDEGSVAAKLAGETRPASHAGKDYLRPLDGDLPAVSFPDKQTLLVAREPMLKNMLAATGENNRLVAHLTGADLDHTAVGLIALDRVRDALGPPGDTSAENWPDRLRAVAASFDLALISADFGGPWLDRIADREVARPLAVPDEPLMPRSFRAPDFGMVLLKGKRKLARNKVEASTRACAALVRSCHTQLAHDTVQAANIPAPLDRWIREAVVKNVFGQAYTVPDMLLMIRDEISPAFALVFTNARVAPSRFLFAEAAVANKAGSMGTSESLRFAASACEEICGLWPHCQEADRLLRIAQAMRMESLMIGGAVRAAHQGPGGNPNLSWRVRLLPLLGHEELYQRFHLDEPWDSPHNRPLIQQMPECYLASGMKNDGRTTYVAVAGPGAVFTSDPPGPAVPRSHRPTFGTGNAIAVVKVAREWAVPWTKPQDWQPEAEDPLRGLVREDGREVFRAGMVDGTVKSVRADLDASVLLDAFVPPKGRKIDSGTIFVDDE